MNMAAIAGMNFATPGVITKAAETPNARAPVIMLNSPWRTISHRRGLSQIQMVRPVKATPDSRITEKMEKSIKDAEEACADNRTSGECAAAWDEVEELSAAASHARDKKKESDPLEEYCKDNPETEECRTYDN